MFIELTKASRKASSGTINTEAIFELEERLAKRKQQRRK